MRTTVTIDDEIIRKAERYFGEMKVSELIENGLRALIAGEAADRLAAMGGTDENAWVAPRRNVSRLAEETTSFESGEK